MSGTIHKLSEVRLIDKVTEDVLDIGKDPESVDQHMSGKLKSPTMTTDFTDNVRLRR